MSSSGDRVFTTTLVKYAGPGISKLLGDLVRDMIALYNEQNESERSDARYR